MLWLFFLGIVWLFLTAYQTKSIVRSQYLRSGVSEFLLCICWFVSLKLIVSDRFSIRAFLFYASGCVIGLMAGIWFHDKHKGGEKVNGIVKVNQKKYYDGLIAQLRQELVELETEGNWEVAGRVQKALDHIKKRREELDEESKS